MNARQQKELWQARYQIIRPGTTKSESETLVRVLADRAVTLGQVGQMSATEVLDILHMQSLKQARLGIEPFDIIKSLPRTIAEIAAMKLFDGLGQTISMREMEALRRDPNTLNLTATERHI